MQASGQPVRKVAPLDQTYSLAGISPLPVKLRSRHSIKTMILKSFAFRDDVTTLFHIDPMSNAITASPLGTDGLNGIICQDLQLGHYDADGYPEIVCLKPTAAYGFENDGSGNHGAIPPLSTQPASDFTLAGRKSVSLWWNLLSGRAGPQRRLGALTETEAESESLLCQQPTNQGIPWLIITRTSEKCGKSTGGIIIGGL